MQDFVKTVAAVAIGVAVAITAATWFNSHCTNIFGTNVCVVRTP